MTAGSINLLALAFISVKFPKLQLSDRKDLLLSLDLTTEGNLFENENVY